AEDGIRARNVTGVQTCALTISPMSLGTWILSGFATCSGVLGALEVDRMTQQRVPLGVLRRVLGAAETPAALGQAALAPLLASYRSEERRVGKGGGPGRSGGA